MKKKENTIESHDAKEALNSINKMKSAGLKYVAPTPKWLGAILGILVGLQVALLGAEIRTFNTILIVLIGISTILILKKFQLARVKERILLSNRKKIVGLVGIISLYFAAIICGQYLSIYYQYLWAPYAIGMSVAIGIWYLVWSSCRSYANRFKEDSL